MMKPGHRRFGLTRRSFLLGAGTCVVAAAGAGIWGGQHWLRKRRGERWNELFGPRPYVRKQFTGKCIEAANPEFAMPGRYPGKVIEVHNPASVVEGQIHRESVKHMIERGMKELTGAPDAVQAWRSMFQKGDRVGIKVNPVGLARNPGDIASISNFEVILEIVEGLKTAGLTLKDIVLYERYADDFRDAGYEKFVDRELPGLKWYASSVQYTELQTDMEGRDVVNGQRLDADPHVLGYDRDTFRKFDFTSPQHNPNDRLSYESHLSKFVTGDLVNKIITIPVLKDHRSGGITMALKNLSHGCVNNVARTHWGPQVEGNQCGIFIPNVVALEPTRKKAVLHIMDGLIGCWEGGPGTWNNSWAVWEYKSLFFATDPVAMDHVGWDIIDAKRAAEGWRLVAEMGVGKAYYNRSGTEAFHCRQPEHVEIAGRKYGLGLFDPAQIEYRRIIV